MKTPLPPTPAPAPSPIEADSPLLEQMQRGQLLAAACPSREVLKHVTSR